MKPDAVLRPLVTDAGIARAREALSSAQVLERLIVLKLSRLDRVKEEEKRLCALGGEDSAAMARIRALERSLLSDYHTLLKRREEVQALILRVPDEKQRAVLEMRYLEGLPFFRIAAELHYDERQIYRYHRAGLLYAAVRMALDSGETPLRPDKTGALEKSD